MMERMMLSAVALLDMWLCNLGDVLSWAVIWALKICVWLELVAGVIVLTVIAIRHKRTTREDEHRDV